MKIHFSNPAFGLAAPRHVPGFAAAAMLYAGLMPALAHAASDQLTPLKPPEGEMPPTFWEQYGWQVVIAALAAITVLALLIFWLRRPKPVVVVAPDVLARRALEALRAQPENGPLLVQVSGILRNYLIFACGLPPGERTTAEIRQAIVENAWLNPDLSAGITDFLSQCDKRKFAPIPPAPDLGAVAAALDLVDKVEQRRRGQIHASPPPVVQPTPP